MGYSGASIPDTPTSAMHADVVVLKGTESTPLPVIIKNGGAQATVTRTAANIAAVTLLAANANRVSAGFYNNATTNLALKLGATPNIGAGTESFTAILLPGGFFRIGPGEYSGIVTGIWYGADANGECLASEVIP